MKYLPVAGKLCAVLFTALVLAACSGSDTKDQDDAAVAAAAAEEAAAQAKAAQMAELQRLEDAAAAVGNVFYFEFDSSALTQESINQLNAHIAVLRQETDRNVRLEGHADERGTREYNMALGERRANSVRDYMVANGIATYRIETVSYGEERPVAYGSGESNWSQNRRVELK
ncbi:MAG: peptidoglycan-associated lipoprotein [Halioglobus sp.]|nr:peptidoglycan-associated lipoprotein [Halioglobus sp.]|tara:strand:+ start:479 stop:994 length:516 start_codon:yes stop_codon:yes gene_type:complete